MMTKQNKNQTKQKTQNNPTYNLLWNKQKEKRKGLTGFLVRRHSFGALQHRCFNV